MIKPAMIFVMLAACCCIASADNSDIQITETCANPMLPYEKKSTESQKGLEAFVEAFKSMDLNQDSMVCYEEVKKANPDGLVVWGRFDLNGDNCITPLEARKGIERNMENTWRAQHRNLDTNRNGQIEEKEMLRRYQAADGGMAPSDFIAEFDTTGDGMVSVEEYIAEMIAIVRATQKNNPHLKGIPPRATRTLNN